jgi:predicted SnoaL-like aldol condensation-catalyzing enzyme
VVERDQRERHKDIVLEAFDTLFNKRDYATAVKFWSEDYVQHSSRIPPGRDGVFEVISPDHPSLPTNLN